MLWWQIPLCAGLGYLLGNIQPGLWLTRKHAKVDLRDVGSGSTGATNTMRVLGTKFAFLTFFIDFAKGLLATLAGGWLFGPSGAILCGLFVVVGHIWPALFSFRGGKGVATSLGALTPLTPLYALIIVAVALAVIALTRYVSLGSLSGTLVYLVLGTIRGISQGDPLLVLFSILVPCLIYFAHRENIGRLLAGKENKFSFHRK